MTSRRTLVIGSIVLLCVTAGVLLLQREARNEAATSLVLEGVAIRSYQQVYGAQGVTANSGGNWGGDCAVVNLDDPDAEVAGGSISVVLTRNSGAWKMTRTSREGAHFDSDDVGSTTECLALSRGKDLP
jgi:hypothetical protein